MRKFGKTQFQKGEITMKNISIYDTEAEVIETMCDTYDVSEAELIEAILDAIKDNDIDMEDYL